MHVVLLLSWIDGGLYLSYQFGAREKAREEQKHRRK